MGPVEVAAGAGALVVVLACAWALVAARRRRRRSNAQERLDDSAIRAEVVRRLERAAAQWDERAEHATGGRGAGAPGDQPSPGPEPPTTWKGPSHAAGTPRRLGPWRRTEVRSRDRAS